MGEVGEVRAHAPPTAFSGTAVENNGVGTLNQFLFFVELAKKFRLKVSRSRNKTPLFSTAVPINAVGGACTLTSRVFPSHPFTSASFVWLVGNSM